MKRRGANRGFTLIEILVVMILVSMIVTVLFQGLAQAIRIRSSAGIETAQVAREAMRRVWYRQLINGLIPDDENGTAIFQGGPTSFRGQSTNAIDFDTGAVLPITVTLEVDAASDSTIVRVTTRSVAVGPHEIALLSLPGMNFAFAYVDTDASQSSVWPRRVIGKAPQLPSAIWIVDGSGNQSTELLTGSILGRRDAVGGLPALLKLQQE